MKKLRLILASALLVCTLAALTSCGGDDNMGMTGGSANSTANNSEIATSNVTANDSGRVSDVITGATNIME